MQRTVILVSGSRNWVDEEAVYKRLVRYPQVDSVLIHGGARGADLICAAKARSLSFQTHCYNYFKDLGKAGGPKRNSCMLGAAINMIRFGYKPFFEAFPMTDSVGTYDMIRKIKEYNNDDRCIVPFAIHIA
jgi:hypothetical protein